MTDQLIPLDFSAIDASLPYQSRYSTFRQYEDYIAQAVSAFPSTTIFEPKDLAVTTFIARLRDCVASLRKHQWPSTKIDIEKLSLIEKRLVFRLEGGRVYAGSTSSAKEKVQAATVEDLGKTWWLELDSPSKDILLSVCCLLQNRLGGAVKITGSTLAVVEMIATKFDVSLTDKGSYLLLL